MTETQKMCKQKEMTKKTRKIGDSYRKRDTNIYTIK